MNTKLIEKKAKRLSKELIIGCVSVGLLGLTAGCSMQQNERVSFKSYLQENAYFSPSLSHACRKYFDDDFIYDADSKGPVNGNDVNLVFHRGKIGVNLDDSRYPSHYRYSKNISSDDKDYPKSDVGDPKPDDEMMRYKIKGKRDLIIYQAPRRRNANGNSIRAIEYREPVPHLLRDIPKVTLRPIYIKKYKDKKWTKVPLYMAEHNQIRLNRDYMLHLRPKEKRSTSLNSLP